ncbi:MAG: VacJ family lipoprotein [Gammaproteobacteria bacterium]|nr:VacJ family lipoprotein [Gammaproteobacteria bacterium]
MTIAQRYQRPSPIVGEGGTARGAGVGVRGRQRLLALAAAVGLAGCAHAPAEDPNDPLEPVNRAVYSFNNQVDRYVARPVAKGYQEALPPFVRSGVGNFFGNLFYPTVIVNDLLQLKFEQGAQDLARFTLNTTVGLGGLFDPATAAGLPAHDEDFGQTFGHWGAGEGWYLMLPLLGPSDNRDLLGSVGDGYASPLYYVNGDTAVPLGVLNAVDQRARLLGADKVVERQFDPYIFVRTIYLQRRQNLVYDGNPPKEDFGFEDDEAAE